MSLTVYDILRRPLVTEKSSFQNEKLGRYVFEVASEASFRFKLLGK